MAGDYVDPRPNVGGMIARQSFSSQKWLHDAGIALEKFIDHLETGKYGDRIMGYHIAYGTSGECVLWGRISARYGDYGIGHKKPLFHTVFHVFVVIGTVLQSIGILFYVL